MAEGEEERDEMAMEEGEEEGEEEEGEEEEMAMEQGDFLWPPGPNEL